MEFCVTHSDPPVRTNLLGLSSSQDNPQFKDGTVYRQVRPTSLYLRPEGIRTLPTTHSLSVPESPNAAMIL